MTHDTIYRRRRYLVQSSLRQSVLDRPAADATVGRSFAVAVVGPAVRRVRFCSETVKRQGGNSFAKKHLRRPPEEGASSLPSLGPQAHSLTHSLARMRARTHVPSSTFTSGCCSFFLFSPRRRRRRRRQPRRLIRESKRTPVCSDSS